MTTDLVPLTTCRRCGPTVKLITLYSGLCITCSLAAPTLQELAAANVKSTKWQIAECIKDGMDDLVPSLMKDLAHYEDMADA